MGTPGRQGSKEKTTWVHHDANPFIDVAAFFAGVLHLQKSAFMSARKFPQAKHFDRRRCKLRQVGFVQKRLRRCSLREERPGLAVVWLTSLMLARSLLVFFLDGVVVQRYGRLSRSLPAGRRRTEHSVIGSKLPWRAFWWATPGQSSGGAAQHVRLRGVLARLARVPALRLTATPCQGSSARGVPGTAGLCAVSPGGRGRGIVDLLILSI